MDALALRLKVARGRDATEQARLAALDFLAGFNLAPETLYKIELVLEETLVNLAWHAFVDDDEHDVHAEVHVEDAQVVLVFVDDGVAFDPTQAVDAKRADSIGEAVPGGLGLILVRKLAQSVNYERVEGRNRLTVRLQR